MPHQIVGIGEILWDVFPDGARFGGAPANFACSAAALAQESAKVHMVSAVGDDQLGNEAIHALQQRHVHAENVQVNARTTGRVLVELDQQGVATYRFDEDSAWDYLQWCEELQQAAETCDAVCFGTLGQRGAMSRETITSFLKATPNDALRILDVNLRAPYYSTTLVDESLKLANVLKLNDDELPYVGQLSGCAGSDIEVMQQLAQKHQLRCVALTRGAEGAILLSGDTVSELPSAATKVVDTVGAGDAFTAAMTLGLLAGESLDAINQNAIATASHVCSQPGATTDFPEHLCKT